MGLSREAEGGVGDVGTKMFCNFVLVVHGADRERDLGGAAQRFAPLGY
jgi:hypothetical protein